MNLKLVVRPYYVDGDGVAIFEKMIAATSEGEFRKKIDVCNRLHNDGDMQEPLYFGVTRTKKKTSYCIQLRFKSNQIKPGIFKSTPEKMKMLNQFFKKLAKKNISICQTANLLDLHFGTNDIYITNPLIIRDGICSNTKLINVTALSLMLKELRIPEDDRIRALKDYLTN